MKNFLIGTVQDVFIGYKHFFHWNLSKISISLKRYVMAFLIATPFLLLFLLTVGVSDLYSILEYEFIVDSITAVIDSNSPLFLKPGMALFFMILFSFLGFCSFLMGLFFNTVLLSELHYGYLNKNTLRIFSKPFFYVDLFFTYLKMSLFLVLFQFLILLFCGILVFLVVYFVFSGQEGGVDINHFEKNNLYSIFIQIILILGAICSAYIFYRFYFSYIILGLEKDECALNCIKKSFHFTKKGKILLQSCVTLLLIGLTFSPIYYLGHIVSFNSEELTYYLKVKNYLQGKDPQTVLSGEVFYKYSGLDIIYSEYSTADIYNKRLYLYLLSWLHFILYFSLVYGTTNAALVGLYKRQKNNP